MSGAPTTYTWPATLRLPSRPPKLVYLDLNHWVALAKANSNHPDGRQFADALSACIAAAVSGAAVFPISDSIYMEVAKIGKYRQRRDLRDVIERVSGYHVITSRVVIAEHEVEALLDRLLGPSPDPIHTMSYLDWGVARAFGKVGGFVIERVETGEDATDEVRALYPGGPEAFDQKLAWAELELNRRVLDGPATMEEAADLDARGYNPKAAYEVARRRAAQETEQVERFNDDPSWRDERIRHVVAAREIIIEINDILSRGVTARGADLGTAFPQSGSARGVFETMPSFDLSVTMKAEYHRNPAHVWKPNHIQDIDALASTVPYCDIVVTDKEAASHLQRSGVAKRFGATILSRVIDLPPHL